MAGIKRSSRLQEAAMEGNVTTLLELLQQDPLLLDRVNNNFSESPLHVAALLGHVGFVEELLKRRPQLAGELGSGGSSALHLAAAKGFVGVVKRLLEVDADLCFLSDGDGLNPVHVAAMRGRVEVLAELVGARPAAARSDVDGGGTVLHLCVKYKQLEAMRMLIEKVGAGDHKSWVNARDDYGFTILHLAVSSKHLQTVEYLINETEIEVNALIANNLTALDIILTQTHTDYLKTMEIAEALTSAGATRTRTRTRTRTQTGPTTTKSVLSRLISRIFNNKTEPWLLKRQDAVMVVASLIATMAFQAAVNPPGGVWQEDNPAMNQTAGTSVLAVKQHVTYNKFQGFNTAGFTAALIVMLMLITGLPSRHLYFLRVLIVAIWVAVSSTAFTYGYSIKLLARPENADSIIYNVPIFLSSAAFTLMGLFLLGKILFIMYHLQTERPNRTINQVP